MKKLNENYNFLLFLFLLLAETWVAPHPLQIFRGFGGSFPLATPLAQTVQNAFTLVTLIEMCKWIEWPDSTNTYCIDLFILICGTELRSSVIKYWLNYLTQSMSGTRCCVLISRAMLFRSSLIPRILCASKRADSKRAVHRCAYPSRSHCCLTRWFLRFEVISHAWLRNLSFMYRVKLSKVISGALAKESKNRITYDYLSVYQITYIVTQILYSFLNIYKNNQNYCSRRAFLYVHILIRTIYENVLVRVYVNCSFLNYILLSHLFGPNVMLLFIKFMYTISCKCFTDWSAYELGGNDLSDDWSNAIFRFKP